MSGVSTPHQLHQARGNLSSHLFVATVVDNNDPLRRQRIRIRVPHIVEGETADLPWAIPVGRSTGGSNLELDVPLLNSYVIVAFQDGDVNNPIWYGGVHADYTGASSITDTNYPNRVGRQTQAGTFWYVDKTTNQVHLTHAGTTITVNSNGSIDVVAVHNVNITTTGNVSTHSNGTTVVDADGAITVSSDSTVTVTGTTINVTGSTAVNVTAPVINLN